MEKITTESLLENAIQKKIKSLENMEVNSEEYKAEVEVIAKLTDRLIELQKHRDEDAYKKQQMTNEEKDRLIKNCLTAASIVTGVGLTIWGTVASFNFEKEGTITTIMGRGFVQKLLPKK